MRYLAELFVKTGGEFSAAYAAKIEEMQKSGDVGKDWSGKIMGKNVTLVLPLEIKKQYKMLLDAECFVNSTLYSNTDQVYELHMRMWEYAKSNMRYEDQDGYTMSDADFDIEFMEQVIFIYLSEVLFPLFHRSCTSVKTLLKQNLKDYINESVNE